MCIYICLCTHILEQLYLQRQLLSRITLLKDMHMLHFRNIFMVKLLCLCCHVHKSCFTPRLNKTKRPQLCSGVLWLQLSCLIF